MTDSSPTRARGTARSTPLLRFTPSRRVERVWPPLDAFLYNMMTINVVIGFAIPFLTAAAYYSAESWALATAVSALLCIAEAIVYAFLASSMPRSGGEYYFQARILSTGVASVFCFTALVIGGALWMAITAWYASRLAVAPLLVALAVAFDSSALLSAAVWCQHPAGVLLLSMVVIAWAAIANILGLRKYASLQRAFWAAALALLITVFVGLLLAQGIGDLPIYREATRRAFAEGYSANPLTGFAGVLAVAPLASFTLVYLGWSTQQSGETKRAGELGVQMRVILVSMVMTAVLSAGIGGLTVQRFGAQTLGASAYLFLQAPESMPLPTVPFIWFCASGSGAAETFGVLTALLFNALFWMYVPNSTLAASRVLLAMSSDRVLPRWIGSLHAKTKAPVNAIVGFSALCLIACCVYSLTSYWKLLFSTAALTNILAFATTCAAGALFPFLKREAYRESTAARFELFGIPLITAMGGAFVVFTGVLLWRFVVDPALSMGLGPTVLMVSSGILYALSLVIYLAFGVLRRDRVGAEIGIFYTETGTGGLPAGRPASPVRAAERT